MKDVQLKFFVILSIFFHSYCHYNLQLQTVNSNKS